MTILAGRLKVLAATASIIVLAEMTFPAQAGGLGGVFGGVTGAVGGVVGGATSAVGGVVGGVAGSTGGIVGGVTGTAGGVIGGTSGQQVASTGTPSTTTAGVLGSPLSHKALVTLKANILGIKAGVYVLDRYGHLVRINVWTADHILKAKANAYVLQGGSLVKVNAKAALAGLKVKGKVLVLDRRGDILKGKVFVGLGGLKAKVGAKVATSGIGVKVAISLGGKKPRTPGNPGNPNNPGNPGTPPGGIGAEVASLSASERTRLQKRCVSVMSNPTAYNRDAVTVCRVLAQLAGL